MMGDCVTPRHSAVMERLRRRIELFRQHHTSCESRYDRASLERLELDRQQTYALHQRCLQAKAKRSSKQRQSQPSVGEGPGSRGPEGAEGAEQSRNSTLIALQETVKRKIERAGSPLGRDQVNGFGDGFPPNKKQCLDNRATNGSPLDSKLGLTESISANGKHEPSDGDVAVDFHPKEMKQEPDDILPIMPPSGSGANSTSLFPDLNLNEQEWSELMEELNCSVAYEDIQDILNDDFEDRKDPMELASTPGPEQHHGGGSAGAQTTGGVGGTSSGGGGGGGVSATASGGTGAGRQAAQGLLPPDLSTVKAEFSPASLDTHSGSPLVNVRSSVPPSSSSSSSLPNSSPSVPPPSSSSPALPPSAQSSRPLQNHQNLPNLQNHLLASKDLSPAQQLQQLAAQQRQQQHHHGPLQHKQNQQGPKFHPQAPHSHPPAWAQMGGTAQSPLGGGFNMDKPTSPSLYQQDRMFNTSQNQLLLSSQPGKGSPKAGSFLQGGPPVMGHSLGHPPPAPQAGAQLNYSNTKPLSHFEASAPRPPSSDQSKTQLMNLLRHQQQQQHLKQQQQQKTMGYRPHLQHPQHPQDPNSFAANTLQQQQQQQPGPGSAAGMGGNHGNTAMGGNHGSTVAMGGSHSNPVAAMGGNHSNPAAAMGGSAAYMNSQQAAVAAALKQQQQRQQQQYLQRQQMIEQEKQRQQQDQQLKRHLSRPPPQYQDQTGQPANQNAFTQPQFTGSSAPMGGVASLGANPAASRMFPPPQGMMGMGGTSVAPPTNAPPQPDMLTANGIYSNANINQQRQQQQQQQQQLYRQNMMKTQNNSAILKQQPLGVRLPGQMGANMSATLNSAHQAPQNITWNQQMANTQLTTQQIANQQLQNQLANHNPQMSSNQLANQQLSNNFSNPQNAFHLQQQQQQQQRLPKMQQFTANRPLNTMNPGQQMMQRAPSLGQQQAAPQQDLSAFGQGNSARNTAGLQCNQGYGVSRAANSQQQISCGYNVASGSFAEESEFVDSLLKGQSTQEWMDDLDELLAGHH